MGMTNPNDPAFPIIDELSREDRSVEFGLTKRELSVMLNQAAILCGIYSNPDHTNISMDDIVVEAQKHTDALIAELSK